jgi:hypothetical protein
MTAHDLVTDLGRAYREGRLDRRLLIYLAPKVLIHRRDGLCCKYGGKTGGHCIIFAEAPSMLLCAEQSAWERQRRFVRIMSMRLCHHKYTAAIAG